MKATIKFLGIISLCVALFAGCTVDEIPNQEEENPVVDMAEYNAAVQANKDLIVEWYSNTKSGVTSKAEVDRSYDSMKQALLPTATKFTKKLHLSDAEIKEMLGVKSLTAEEKEEAELGILLFASMADCSNNGNVETRGGTFKDCFLEATGIADGLIIVGALTVGTMSKIAIRKMLKLVVRVSVKGCCGIGLALMAAEIAICMYC